jgi:hypothetical protein
MSVWPLVGGTTFAPDLASYPNDSLFVGDTTGGDINVRIDDDSTTGYAVGSKLTIAKVDGPSSKYLLVQPGTGTTILTLGYTGPSGPAVLLGGAAVLYHTATDQWLLSGDYE